MYKYETHLHSSECSACGEASAADQVKIYSELGFSGMIITDHFLNGNSCISPELDWPGRIDEFYRSYSIAEKAAKNSGGDFQVFFGLEYNYHGTEFLVYNVEPQFLKDNPLMLSWELDTFFYEFKKAGAFIVHAHPFRKRAYITEIRLFPDKVDAVEIYNAANEESWNLEAEEYARKQGLPVISGSDFHGKGTPGKGGIMLQKRAESIEDILVAISEKSCLLRKG